MNVPPPLLLVVLLLLGYGLVHAVLSVLSQRIRTQKDKHDLIRAAQLRRQDYLRRSNAPETTVELAEDGIPLV